MLFGLTLKDNRTSFLEGEPIGLLLSFSSTGEGYRISNWSDRSGRSRTETYCVAPEVTDPLAWYFRQVASMDGLGSGGPLSAAPSTTNADLNEWFLVPPGHYHVHVVSRRVTQALPGGDARVQGVVLRSNVVEFDVLPSNADWQTEQIHRDLQALANASLPNEAVKAAH